MVDFDRQTSQLLTNHLAGASTVVFDLWGTLVAPFRRKEHEDVIRRCATLLSFPFELLHEGWVKSYQSRIRGEFSSVAENLQAIVGQHGQPCSESALQRAEDEYLEFTAAGLEAADAVLSTLEILRSQNKRLGLITNCAPDVPQVWPECRLSKMFDATVFSCQEGITKPTTGIYMLATKRLGVATDECVYVGDGSDNELAGAQEAGMFPILLEVDLTNTYDQARPEVQDWRGQRIAGLSQLVTRLL